MELKTYQKQVIDDLQLYFDYLQNYKKANVAFNSFWQDKVGFYNPVAAANVEAVRIDTTRVDYWSSVGAQVSPAVQKLIKNLAA